MEAILKIPKRFASVVRGPFRLLAREDLAERIVAAGVVDEGDPLCWKGALGPIAAGRGNVVPVEFSDHPPLRVIVKSLMRGGLFGRLNRRIHFSQKRLFRAVDLSVRLVDRGVPASEVLFGRSEKIFGPFFRLSLATKEIEEAEPLLSFLAGRTISEKRKSTVARVAGESVRSLHDAGVIHADLNMNNLLVAPAGDGTRPARVFIIDLDGSRVVQALGDKERALNLTRLLRHAVKNSLHRSVDLSVTGRSFLEGYCGDGDSQSIESRVLRILKRTLPLHRLSWRMQGIDPPPVSFER